MKNAQEAHEAIRPAGDAFRTPDEVAGELDARRARALRADLEAHRRLADGGRARADGLGAARRDRRPTGEDAEFGASRHGDHLPRLPRRLRGGPRRRARRATTRSAGCRSSTSGDARRARRRSSREGHATTPPARYTEATLVQGARGARHRPPVDVRVDHRHDPRPRLRLQEGHGARADLPRVRGRRSCSSSTSRASSTTTSPRGMEDDLDRIAEGEEDRVDWLSRFYFGRRTASRACTRSSPTTSTRSTRATVNSIAIPRHATSSCASAATGRTSSAARSGRSLPDDIAPDELTRREGRGAARAAVRASASSASIPRPAAPIVARDGRYGPYVTEVLAGGRRTRSRAPASLFKTMSLETVTLDDALRLLSLPRTLGGAGRRGDQARTAATARTSRRARRRARSTTEEQLFTITLEEALALLAQPKQRRGRGAAEAAAEGARRRSRDRQADRRQGRPVRPVRHRRRDEREPAPRRRRRGADARAGARAARRAARQGARAEEARAAAAQALTHAPPSVYRRQTLPGRFAMPSSGRSRHRSPADGITSCSGRVVSL